MRAPQGRGSAEQPPRLSDEQPMPGAPPGAHRPLHHRREHPWRVRQQRRRARVLGHGRGGHDRGGHGRGGHGQRGGGSGGGGHCLARVSAARRGGGGGGGGGGLRPLAAMRAALPAAALLRAAPGARCLLPRASLSAAHAFAAPQPITATMPRGGGRSAARRSRRTNLAHAALGGWD
eukprot:6179508-Pleurochrysis_carterae.AAC.1